MLVRDDFWLAVSRFLADLEVELIQGHNTALVDLFDTRHAAKVLTAFGAALGNLPENGREITKEQRLFLDQAIAELAQDGKVVSVRLALFAEMVKGKPWTPATLREVGGAAGVGVTFLEETFISPQANPRHRMHQKAAQAVLKALLPDSGTDIKGQMRSEQELQSSAGNAARPRDFHEVLHILDSELRLITPTDPEGSGAEQPAAAAGRSVLSADPRLPRPFPSRLADQETEGDPPGAGGAQAGGPRLALEQQARESASAFDRRMGEYPAADQKDETGPRLSTA